MAEHRKNVLAELRVDANQNVVFAKAQRKLVTATKTGLVRIAMISKSLLVKDGLMSYQIEACTQLILCADKNQTTLDF